MSKRDDFEFGMKGTFTAINPYPGLEVGRDPGDGTIGETVSAELELPREEWARLREALGQPAPAPVQPSTLTLEELQAFLAELEQERIGVDITTTASGDVSRLVFSRTRIGDHPGCTRDADCTDCVRVFDLTGSTETERRHLMQALERVTHPMVTVHYEGPTEEQRAKLAPWAELVNQYPKPAEAWDRFALPRGITFVEAPPALPQREQLRQRAEQLAIDPDALEHAVALHPAHRGHTTIELKSWTKGAPLKLLCSCGRTVKLSRMVLAPGLR